MNPAFNTFLASSHRFDITGLLCKRGSMSHKLMHNLLPFLQSVSCRLLSASWWLFCMLAILLYLINLHLQLSKTSFKEVNDRRLNKADKVILLAEEREVIMPRLRHYSSLDIEIGNLYAKNINEEMILML